MVMVMAGRDGEEGFRLCETGMRNRYRDRMMKRERERERGREKTKKRDKKSKT